MPDFVVESIVSNEDRPDRGNGPMRAIKMNLAGEGTVEWFTKAATQPPAVGSTISGAVENDPKWGKKFKKAFGGGGGGPRPEDPARAKRILRQHSQDMAIGTLQLAHSLGMPFDGVTSVGDLVGRIKKLADVFDKDAEAAAK